MMSEPRVVQDGADEVGSLLDAFGSESVLAANLTKLRKERGWSQETLARRMREVGYPVPQSAISKIEKPAPGGRRAIQVDEAIAYAKAFGVGLPELLLPDGTLQSISALRSIREALRLKRSINQELRSYEVLLAEVVEAAHQDWRVFNHVGDALHDLGIHFGTGEPLDGRELPDDQESDRQFYMDVLDGWRARRNGESTAAAERRRREKFAAWLKARGAGQ